MEYGMSEQLENQPLVFVVHKHQATTLHYDFRLEIGGVMPSWAIPRGPTLDPRLKRLAMPTTDHSLEYRHFEGVLNEGQYGAGPVMVWDEGSYVLEREKAKGVREEVTERTRAEAEMQNGLAAGMLNFRLYGHKLQGSFALIRTHAWAKRRAGSSSSMLMAIRRHGMRPMSMIFQPSVAALSPRSPRSHRQKDNPPLPLQKHGQWT
jgi:DNA ligase D-like protein (predicted 3'-phosphoesterase)